MREGMNDDYTAWNFSRRVSGLGFGIQRSRSPNVSGIAEAVQYPLLPLNPKLQTLNLKPQTWRPSTLTEDSKDKSQRASPPQLNRIWLWV